MEAATVTENKLVLKGTAFLRKGTLLHRVGNLLLINLSTTCDFDHTTHTICYQQSKLANARALYKKAVACLGKATTKGEQSNAVNRLIATAHSSMSLCLRYFSILIVLDVMSG